MRPKTTKRRTLLAAAWLCAVVVVVHTAYANHLSKEDVKRLVDRCEAEREKRVAPLRETAIKECIELGRGRTSPEECRNMHRDFGQAYMRGDRLIPRMFHNLPECAEATEAENHFGLYPR